MSQSLLVRRADPGTDLVSVLRGLERQAVGGDPTVTALRHFPSEAARFVELPPDLDPRLSEVLARRGMGRLFSHQREAYDLIRDGRSIVVVTPTASGKTLCYNLPILDTVLKEPEARALYLFPTKALAQDQLAELHEMCEALGSSIGTFTYDGDTPRDARKAIRSRAHLVLTNPDMLHKGILPHHTKWVKLLENLRFIVVDELHSLRGVYGSHVANVFRRLRRLCRFYGSDPQLICSSATIANPAELAEKLTGHQVVGVDRSGAPRGERYFAIYNPPVVNRQLGIRKSAMRSARDIALQFLRCGLQTIVFAPSRLTTEVMVTHLKQAIETRPGSEGVIRGYRGGYLPRKRREIERGLRAGSVLGVVSTNALELGVDIGSLDAAVLLGYPGSVASTWQQAGRAGRRESTSVAVLVANSSPLNQYIARHPEYVFDAPVERARINPDNLQILVDHVKCAAFELPFTSGDTFGGEDLAEILGFLEEEGLVHRAGDRWHWTSESYPADAVNLRSVSSDNFVVQDITREPRIIAEVDFDSAPMMLHEKAIYILEGRSYFVERYDHAERRAHVREAEVDYYTDAITYTKVRILESFASERVGEGDRNHGEVHVTSQVVGFKKIKLETGENVGSGELQMPENEMHTTGYWLTIPRTVMSRLPYDGEARRDGVVALAHALGQLASLFLMCDRHDIGVALGDNRQGEATVTRGVRRLTLPMPQEAAASDDYEPKLFLYDSYPSGIGLAPALYELHTKLLCEAETLIRDCPCHEGCPACVGPSGEVGGSGKEVALRLLEELAVPRA